MKINYNGQELETITEGYWPEGMIMVGIDDCGRSVTGARKVFYLRDGHAIFDGKENGTCWMRCSRWAVIPAKPAPRRLTNREVHNLCQKGWSLHYDGQVFGQHDYPIRIENEKCNVLVTGVRAPDSDEWLEPTSDLLEVGK